jgi:hypothetical protein
LASNWLSFVKLPKTIYYFEPVVGFPPELFTNRNNHSHPIAPHSSGILTFQSPGKDGRLEEDVPTHNGSGKPLELFFREGWIEIGLDVRAARAKFSDLANQAFERLALQRGLKPYAIAVERQRWWGDLRTYPLTQIAFSWANRKRGRRQIMGQSEKRGVFWHYSINGQARNDPLPHFRIYAGLVFSANGTDALNDSKKMHRLRRSFAKWRNARWRDMLLAFLWWLGRGASSIELPISNTQRMVLGLPPMRFQSPVSVSQAGAPPPDEDDPDVDLDLEDEDVFSDEESPAELGSRNSA